MKTLAGSMIALTLFVAALIAQPTPKSVAGAWTVKVVGEVMGGHSLPPVDMELEQSGTKVSGNFMIANHGDLPIEGEFVDGTLKVHATEDAFMKMELTGTFNEDGLLSGKMSSQMGDLTWTAERRK